MVHCCNDIRRLMRIVISATGEVGAPQEKAKFRASLRRLVKLGLLILYR